MKEYRNARGHYHRVDGPAIERSDGSKYWYQNGQLHRVDGPAIEHASGTRYWFWHGQRHRVDGPAYEGANGNKVWFLYGQNITDEVESWIKEYDITVPFDKQTQVLFLLRFG